MSWSFLIAFAIAIGVYLVIVGVFAVVKVYKRKKNAKDNKEESKE